MDMAMDRSTGTEANKINDAFLDLFRELIHDKFGISISREKDYLIQSKIGKLLKDSEYKNVAEFYYALKHEESGSLERLVRYITTTYTFFFREPLHMKILCNDILFRHIEKPVIWCAASSTGEEVYSMIISLIEHGIMDFLVVASDLNRDVLVHMKRGIYHIDRFKDVDKAIIDKYFLPLKGRDEKHFVAKDFLKKFFIAKRLNLVEHIRFERPFDYIFCRNVLIYFDRDTQNNVVDSLIDNLSDTVYLFVGHSESLLNMNNKIESVFTSVYNKKR
jgi:chemotaxis protein methyltransferase CheR